MKKIAMILLKLGLALRITFIDRERNRNVWINIVDQSQVNAIDEDAIGLSISCGSGDVVALAFINPAPDLIKNALNELNLPLNYKWIVAGGNRHIIFFRLTHLLNHFGKDEVFKLEPNNTEQVEKISIKLRIDTPFAPFAVGDNKFDFVNGEIDESTPPHEVHVDKLIKCLAGFTNINTLLQKIEAENKESLNQESSVEFVETSTLPFRIFEKVPRVLRNFTKLFSLPREKDMAFLAMLVVVSCCIPAVVSTHKRKKIWACLYLVITAGAASGKGVLSDVLQAVGKIEKSYREKYERELKQYKSDKKRFKDGEIDEEPIVPKRQTLQLPTDNSFIAFFKQLVDNGERGLMFETEIDVFINAGKQEWGNYSTVNRKAAHHEPHTLDRKYLDEPLHVAAPRIGMVMSGTPNQFFNLFQSIEDGLYSRFMVYCFQLKEINLINPYINDSNELFDNTIEETSNVIFEMYQALIALNHEIRFEWTEKQAITLYEHFKKTLQTSDPIYGEGTASVILRHMLVATRLGMVLAALEYFETGELLNAKVINANDDTVDVVIGIVDTCAQHSLLMMNNIKANAKARPVDMRSMKMIQFLNALPEGRSFKTKDAIEMAGKLKISARSVGDYLPALCKSGHVEQIAMGQYRRKK